MNFLKKYFSREVIMGNIAGDILLLLSIDPVYTQGTPFILGGEISNIIESPKKSWFEWLFLHFFILLLLIYIINWFSQDLAPPILLQNRKYIVWNKYKYIKKKLNFQKDIWNPLRNLYFFFSDRTLYVLILLLHTYTQSREYGKHRLELLLHTTCSQRERE